MSELTPQEFPLEGGDVTPQDKRDQAAAWHRSKLPELSEALRERSAARQRAVERFALALDDGDYFAAARLADVLIRGDSRGIGVLSDAERVLRFLHAHDHFTASESFTEEDAESAAAAADEIVRHSWNQEG